MTEKSLERAHQFAEFCNEHERFPSVKTNDPHEHKLAVWIVQMRRSKRETSTKHNCMVLYPEVETFLNERVPNWLDGAGQRIGNRLRHCEHKARSIVSFFKEHARFPVATLGTPHEERVLANFLNRMRMAKKRTSKFVCELHPSVERILDEGIPMWMFPHKYTKRTSQKLAMDSSSR
jgi:hypothetical protein